MLILAYELTTNKSRSAHIDLCLRKERHSTSWNSTRSFMSIPNKPMRMKMKRQLPS